MMRETVVCPTNNVAKAVALAFLIAGGVSANAANPIATVYGIYDAEDGVGDLPASVTNGLAVAGDGGVYDSPTLFFVNPTGYTITNAQMVLTVSGAVNSGQNTLNNGSTQTVSLGSLAASTVTEVTWAGGGLFAYDYDDEYSSNYGQGIAGNSGSAASDCTLNTVGGHPEWSNFCAPVGSFLVQFSGTLMGAGSNNGQSVAAVFAEYDVNGVYTGWQGLDPLGWSENNLYDVHSGTVSGVLANIYLGTVGTVPGSPTSPVPEPASAALMLGGFGLVAAMLGRRRRDPASGR